MGHRTTLVSTASSDITISYEDAGQGQPALLLLPGWASSRVAFAPLVPRLAKSHRVLSLDPRGHGGSTRDVPDFGTAEVADDAQAVIEASGARTVIPVALSHAGWAAIELRKRLRDRIPKIVFLDWIMLDPPPPFLGALAALQREESWRDVRDQLFSMWLAGTNHPEVSEFLSADMASYPFAMWARAGREIAKAYGENENPVQALSALDPPVPVLHIYAQPPDPGYLDAQKAIAARHPWFQVEKLDARTHFPMFEMPERLASVILRFVAPASDSGVVPPFDAND